MELVLNGSNQKEECNDVRRASIIEDSLRGTAKGLLVRHGRIPAASLRDSSAGSFP